MRVRTFLICVAVGAVVGVGMIALHAGPGIQSRPSPSTAGSRNQQRVQLLNQLQAALIQYKKVNGSLPVKLTPVSTEICTSIGPTYCKHLVDLSFLTTEGDYLPTMPTDPLGDKGNWASGFFIQQSGNIITITAPEAEQGKTIAVNFTL